METSIRPHQIWPLQQRINGGYGDVASAEGNQVAKNEANLLQKLLDNPTTMITITSGDSSICSNNCKIRKASWHHCKGFLMESFEKEQALAKGLEIGKSYPANEIFSIPQ